MNRPIGRSMFFCLMLLGLAYLLFGYIQPGTAQNSEIEAAGGGQAPISPMDEISEEQRSMIRKEIAENIAHLEAEGSLAPASPQFVSLSWPVRKAPGLVDTGVDGISNFVDHNLGFPGLILDWNCGTRSYDQSSGYNHKGIDIFTWPFSWKKMDS